MSPERSRNVGKSKWKINKEAIHYFQLTCDREKNGCLIFQVHVGWMSVCVCVYMYIGNVA